MKTKMKLIVAAMLAMVVISACNNTEKEPDNSIEGTYVGTLSTNGLKSANGTMPGSTNAKAKVTKANNGQIEVHCYSDALDTTFMLNYYTNHDSIMVCLTGDNFKHMYGHILGEGHMGGGMMGDISSGETEWQHHMNDEHKNGDEHFGGFNMGNHSFGYSLRMEGNSTPYYLHFQGTKNE